MPLIPHPVPFREAIRRNDVRQVMPTNLSHAELRELGNNIHQRAFTSAKTTLEEYLQTAQEQIGEILEPKIDQREEGDVNVGPNPATVRLKLKQTLARLGYQPDPEKRGTIEDLSSDQRINLVIKTNTDVARGYGSFIQGQDEAVLDQWPAQELYRAEDRERERDWRTRWLAAAQEAGDTDAIEVFGKTGRMIALKDSEIWQALGDGAGGYNDTLGNPYPPFAFRSGMDVQDIDRAEAEELGLLDPGEQVKPQEDIFALATA